MKLCYFIICTKYNTVIFKKPNTVHKNIKKKQPNSFILNSLY